MSQIPPQAKIPSEDCALADKLQRAVAQFEERDMRTIAAAYAIIHHFLGNDFMDARLQLLASPDPFMLNKLEQDEDRYIFMTRVASLADYLFRLRKSPSFATLVDRLTKREARAPYYEAMIASRFQEQGFEVTIREEVGVKKEDFDFHATKQGLHVNVEVTAFDNVRFTPQTVTNKLTYKRKRVPDTAPLALFCMVPMTWVEHYRDLQFGLMETTYRFFSKSHAFNVVNYTWHPIVKIDENRIFAQNDLAVFNLDPHHEWRDQAFLVEETPSGTELRRVNRRNDPSEWDRLATKTAMANPFAYLDFLKAIEAEAASSPQTGS
jgi:hypothetical protein